MTKRIWLLLFMALSLGQAKADDSLSSGYTWRQTQERQRIRLDLIQETGFYQRDGRSLRGFGLGLGLRYGLNEKFLVGLSMAQALNFSPSPSALYTAIRVKLAYALRGSYIVESRILSVNDRAAVTERGAGSNTLGVLVGLDQYMFNATSSVVPGSGVSTGLSYDFGWMGLNWIAEGRAGILSLNGAITQSLNANIGVSFLF